MKSISLIDKKSSAMLEQHWVDSFARHTLLKLLKNIQKGHLTLEDNGEIYSFGEPHEKTSLVTYFSNSFSVLSSGFIWRQYWCW
jgi:cyclopropane-fatty-acyl-phospholipid synthase